MVDTNNKVNIKTNYVFKEFFKVKIVGMCALDRSLFDFIVVDEGGLLEETFDDEDITYSCSYDLNLFFNKAPILSATIKVRETWEIEGRGYIETLAVEYLYDLYGPNYYGAGSFVEHGEIDGQKIKLSGEAGTGATGPFREGIVMGWPTP
jgi:hypothetical protein